jgi:hypothetical protein
MENDLILKNFLKNDNKINKIETKLLLEYHKCKLEKCYNKNLTKYTHEDYETCKDECMGKINKFKMTKNFLYKDFTEFYYEKFLSCSSEYDENKYIKCKDELKLLQKKNIEEIKKIILNLKL